MLQLLYFSRKDQLLAELARHEGVQVVAPSPAKADVLRRQVSMLSGVDVLTISKFTSDLLLQHWPLGDGPTVKRKAELLLVFGVLRSRFLSELGFEEFIQSYNVFSDLRSYSLDLGALGTVLDEYPPEIKKTITIFWSLLGALGYVDEHGASHELSEALRRSSAPTENKTFVFWGFRHLNGQQVDLLKALAIRHTVLLPIPQAVRAHFKHTDWPSWFGDQNARELAGEADGAAPTVQWVPVNSGELALSLKRELEGRARVLLGVSRLDESHMQLVPSSNMNFKIPHELLRGEIRTLFRSLRASTLEGRSRTELATWLEEDRRRVLDPRRGTPSFKRLKTLQLVEEALGEIDSMTDEPITVDAFFIRLLEEVILLNQPRTSWTPLHTEESEVELSDLASLEEIEAEDRVILCIDERFQEVISLGQNYPENVSALLATLGPLKRNELELQFLRCEFLEVVARARVRVLMPETILKQSLFWKRIFEGVSLERLAPSPSRPTVTLMDHLAPESVRPYTGGFSASRLQTYIDCPRKFYFSFVENLRPQTTLTKDVDALVSGTIVHLIIEEYHRRGLSEAELEALVDEVLGGYISEQNLELPPEVLRLRKLIFTHRSLNGIRFLRALETRAGSIDWRIEESFVIPGSHPLKGKIDCLGVGKDHLFLLDFKSSKGAAATTAEVESFESIQLWVYALAARSLIPEFQGKKLVLGFVVLDNPCESNLLLYDEGLLEELKSGKQSRAKAFALPPEELLSAAEAAVLGVIQRVAADQSFPSRPRKPDSCTFCALAPVCVRREITL